MRTEVVDDPDNPGQLIVARYGDRQHMHAVADVCKALHNEGITGSSDMPVLGHYPAEVIEQYCSDRGITFAEFMRDPIHPKNIMRDPALRHFRVSTGAV